MPQLVLVVDLVLMLQILPVAEADWTTGCHGGWKCSRAVAAILPDPCARCTRSSKLRTVISSAARYEISSHVHVAVAAVVAVHARNNQVLRGRMAAREPRHLAAAALQL